MEANTTTASTPANSDEPVTSRSSTMENNEASACQCANCTKPASHRCSGCVEGRENREKERQISYCSKECQRAHWAAGHKLECKVAMERCQLFRIGAMMQWTFHRGREHGIKNVFYEDEGETGEGGHKHLVVQLDASDEGNFTRFPAELFPKEREKQAVLVDGAGKSAVASTAELLATLIKGPDYSLPI
jgi:hypothetical protein